MNFASKNLTVGQLNALVKRVGGEDAALRMLSESFEVKFPEPPLVYPDWVREHLTPELEATTVCDPGKVELWLHPRQRSGNPYPSGNEVYEALKDENLLKRSLSLGHLKWYEENPDKIPAEFRGKWIYGWASVVRDAGGYLRVPCLRCSVGRPCVYWRWLGGRWSGNGPAGLRAS